MGKKLTNGEYIEKAKIKHNNYYIYDKVNYIGTHKKIIITCPNHGEFEQMASSHLSGRGCRKCSNKMLHDLKIYNIDWFLNKAKKIHGNKNDYSKVNYTGIKNKVFIICKKHGEFFQSPEKHLLGNNCPKCCKNKKIYLEDFLKRANFVHKNKYNYSLVQSLNQFDHKIEIICNKHGKFRQNYMNHLNGQGCPRCKTSKGELKIEEFLIHKKIVYDSQFSFDDLFEKRKLKFDFAVFNNKNDKEIKNPSYLIEYDGIQHFKATGWSTLENLESTKRKDKLKDKYCKLHNINLIRIKYTNYTNIEDILNLNLKGSI
jgi:hypothetical protein